MLVSVAAFLHRFGEVVGNVVLGVIYFVLLGPVAVVARLVADPLCRRPPKGSSFLPWQSGNDTLPLARRQG